MALGDVSGKGMPASLMMMQLQGSVQVLRDEPEDLGTTMTRINKITCAKCPSNRFITFLFCVMDPATGAVAYATAGHNLPYLVRANGDIEMLAGGGLPLGIFASSSYAEQRCHMNSGDILVLYSDGVTEAQSPSEEEFGEDRFQALLQANLDKSAQEIVKTVN